MDYLSVVEMLNACHGPAGDERQIASTIQRLAEPYATTAGQTPWAISLSIKRGAALRSCLRRTWTPSA